MELRAANRHGSASNKNSVLDMGKTPRIIESELLSAAEQRDKDTLARLGKKPVLMVRDS